MSRRIDPRFQELLAAALLFWLPAHRDHGLSERQAQRRLETATALPHQATRHWPAACRDLLTRARTSVAEGRDAPGGIDKASIQAAADARWTPAAMVQAPHYAWQDRADIGDGPDYSGLAA